MFEPESYELRLIGEGRKLELFDGVLVDRPCPAAAEFPATKDYEPERNEPWNPQLRFEGRTGAGKWIGDVPPKSNWMAIANLDGAAQADRICFELSATASGQVGVFPEQAANWSWLAKKCAARCQKGATPPRILNLFAYTGGSTLAAAAGGAEVTHVDSAKSVVNWAKRNAAHSGLSKASIRWIVEDAPKFVAREVKRGNRYDGIILDPPTYGHGPKREEWKLARDLIELLSDCKRLLSDTPACFLLSCHTPGFGEPELSAALSTCLFGSCGAGVKTRPLTLQTSDGQRLEAGHAAYWP